MFLERLSCCHAAEVFVGHLECWSAGTEPSGIRRDREFGLDKFDRSSSSHPTKFNRWTEPTDGIPSLQCSIRAPPLTSFHLPFHPVDSQCMLRTRCYPLTWFVEQLVVIVGPPRRKPRQMTLPERPAGSAKRPRMASRPIRPRLGIPWLP